MKTKEEVIRHLNSAGYAVSDFGKIMGFLIGKNLKDADEVLQVKIGNHTFNDFLVWFSVDFPPITTDEIEYGDYVHVCEGCNVIAITLMEDEPKKFVGCNGKEVGCYILGKDSRMCTDEELAKVMNVMHDNCLDFDYSSFRLVPLSDSYKEDEQAS